MTLELNLRELNCVGIIEHSLPVYHCKAALKQSVNRDDCLNFSKTKHAFI